MCVCVTPQQVCAASGALQWGLILSFAFIFTFLEKVYLFESESTRTHTRALEGRGKGRQNPMLTLH